MQSLKYQQYFLDTCYYSTNTCPRIPTIIFLALVTIFTLTLTYLIILLLIRIAFVLMTLHLQSHQICFVTVLASFLFFIILNTLTFTSFVFLETNIFGDKTLQLSLHLTKLIMSG